MRALLTAMTAWVKDGAPPPASQYPKLADGTLVPATKAAFPAIPGVQAPSIIAALRVGQREVPFLVAQVGADGNERAGVRTAELLVPLQTYTGWNFRNAKIGGMRQIVPLLGSAIPLAATKAARAATHDPRPSIEELHPTRDGYLAASRAVSETLVKEGYLLRDDLAHVAARAEEQWAHRMKP